MGRIKEQSNNFLKGNYHGLLDHDGKIMVAKYDVEQTITKIFNDSVFVRGVGKKYECQIHKDLKEYRLFLDEGDIGFVKFRKGTAYLVGFQKKPKIDNDIVIEGDSTLLEYFQEQKKLFVRGGGLE